MIRNIFFLILIILLKMNEYTFKRCNICFEEEIETDREMILTNCSPCNHGFCHNCLSEWFIQNTNCPICRKEFQLKDIYQFKSNFRLTKKKIYHLKALLLFNEINEIHEEIETINDLIGKSEHYQDSLNITEYTFNHYKNEIDLLEKKIVSKFSSNTWILSNKIVKERITQYLEKYINITKMKSSNIKLGARKFLDSLDIF